MNKDKQTTQPKVQSPKIAVDGGFVCPTADCNDCRVSVACRAWAKTVGNFERSIL
jgi:radical SAM superfamily enzyme